MTTTLQTARVPATNRLVLGLLATPWGRRLLPGLTALRFTGRRTGRSITVPVAYVAAGADIVVLVGRSPTKLWWRNFRGGHPVEVLVDGRWRRGVGDAVTPERLEYPRLLAMYRRTHAHTSTDQIGSADPIVHFVLPPTAAGASAGRVRRRSTPILGEDHFDQRA